jgi:hypothetical protein
MLRFGVATLGALAQPKIGGLEISRADKAQSQPFGETVFLRLLHLV